MPVNLSVEEFEAVVSEALNSLPPRFRDYLENVAIAVEEEPSQEDYEDSGDDAELLGIYRGVPVTERTHDDPLLPDEIAVFRGPVNRYSRSRREAVEEIRETVIHEIGHLFGLDEDELP